MTEDQQLAIAHQCERLIHLYYHLLDARDFERLAALYAEDGVLARPSDPTHPLSGRDIILREMKSRPATGMTRHLAANVVIDVVSPNEARGISYVVLYRASGERTTAAGYAIADPVQVVGTFDDRFIRTAEGWRFARRQGAIHLATE